jgi:acyl-coenzyme A synthetase/AMP-(fatty) acid ligase/aryl carrier-like protein
MFEIVQQVCERNTDKLAVVSEQELLSFTQLLAAVELCAQTLQRKNCPLVVIHTASRVQAIVLMLAAIKLGKPFVPIDSDKAFDALVEQLNAVQQSSAIEQLDLATGQIHWQAFVKSVGEPLLAPFLLPELQQPGLMSVMFTSGSTGKPKGVLVPCSAVVNLLHQPSFFDLTDDDIFATYSPLSFDASTFEIFTPLLNGNTLIILDKWSVMDADILAGKVEKHSISCLWMTAGLFNKQVLSDNFEGLMQINKLFVGGDKIQFDAALQYVDCCPNNQLFNGYGPTENTVFTTVARLTNNTLFEREQVPIGQLVDGIEHQLLDSQQKPVADEDIGRLYVSGSGLSLGYLARDGQTPPGFVRIEDCAGRYYDTGDYVQRSANGQFYFVGRDDRQVKLNGHRIDLNDLEQRCLSKGLFTDVLTYMSDVADGLVLVARQLPFNPLDESELQAALMHWLNPYEVPKRLVLTDDWPLTSNNKADLKRIINLTEQDMKHQMVQNSSQNRSPVLAIVEDLLNVRVKNKHISLFDMGLDSVSIIELKKRISDELGQNIGVLALYETVNLEGLEKRLMKRYWTEEQDYYLKQTTNTDMGSISYLAQTISDDVFDIFQAARNVVEHHAGINTDKIPLNRYVEMEIDKVSDMLETLAKNGITTLAEPIPLEKKVVGNCFNISKVAVSLLRQKGIPARIRYAYCSYFYPDFSHEQALVEYWDSANGRWKRGDASMNHEIMDHLEIDVDIDLLDVSPELSQPIADVWIGCRSGKLDFADYGASVENRKRGGLGHVAHKLTHDLACLNQIELMACDFIALPKNYLMSRNLKLEAFDEVSQLLADTDFSTYRFTNTDIPLCAVPRRILRKSRFTGVNVR